METELLNFLKTLEARPNVRTLDGAQLERAARPFGKQTQNESHYYFSNVRSRSAGVTVYLGSEAVRLRALTDRQQSIFNASEHTLKQVIQYLKNAPLICVKRTIGDNPHFNPKCTLFLSTQRSDNIRQAYLWSNTLREYSSNAPGPDLFQICLPEWPENDRQVLVMPEGRLTVVLGSDYVGEVKMAFLRQAMYDAKQEGMLSLHAGSKVLRARNEGGELKQYGMLFFGLSGTGKTTHSCHEHGLTDPGEGIGILQDDIVFLRRDGSALGTEKGFYLKTEGISPEAQPIIHKALTGPWTLLENVYVDYAGKLDFNNVGLTGNGRAVIPRESMTPYITESLDLPPLNEMDGILIAFITRRMTVLPIVSRLSPEQAARAFMLGESIETSAGDPQRAGESVRVVGTNPFIVGDETAEGNWFYEFLKSNEDKVRCYLLNTGGVGEVMERDDQGKPVVKRRALRVEIPEMAAIIRGIARDTITWEKEPLFDTLVPTRVEGVDVEKFRLDRFYSNDQVNEYAERLKGERREWLAQFPNLDSRILS